MPGTAADVRPRVAAVGGPPEPRVRASARHRPRHALGLPHRREQHARVVRIQREVDGPRPLAPEEHVLPGGAAVAGAEHAALAVRAPGMPQRRHVHGVGVSRVHAHPADVAAIAEAEVPPRAAPVVGAIDAVAVGDVAADARLAGADVDHVRRGRAPPRSRPPRRSRRSRRRRSPSRRRHRSSSTRRPRRRRSRTSRARWDGRPPPPRARRGAARRSASGAI